jgi:broad-specificity NMP kinase
MTEKKPIFLITGASGSGKSTVIPELLEKCSEHITLDLDAIYGPLNEWSLIKNIWIHFAKQICLNGRTTILCGTFMPGEYDQVDLKDYFRPYFIGLYCDDKTRELRLRARGWSDELVHDHKKFNDWILNNATTAFSPSMPLINTSASSPSEVAEQIIGIVNRVLVENTSQ